MTIRKLNLKRLAAEYGPIYAAAISARWVPDRAIAGMLNRTRTRLPTRVTRLRADREEKQLTAGSAAGEER